jgi:hypothetical protein
MTDTVFLAIFIHMNDNDCVVHMQIQAFGHICPGTPICVLVCDNDHDPARIS